MFFSCCDWESAMEMEKKGQTAFKSFHVNNKNSHDIDSLFKLDNKRTKKVVEKQEATVSKFSD